MGVNGLDKADVFDDYFDVDKIPSFQRDHDEIEAGLYLQEHRRNICTFDLRFVKPNTEFIPIDAIHTIEHLFATWLKVSCDNQSVKDIVVSFNPGGCQTMFYLEVFDDYMVKYNCNEDFLTLEIARVLVACIDWCEKQTEVPGATPKECGNYKSHNLPVAKEWLRRYKEVLLEQFN